MKDVLGRIKINTGMLIEEYERWYKEGIDVRKISEIFSKEESERFFRFLDNLGIKVFSNYFSDEFRASRFKEGVLEIEDTVNRVQEQDLWFNYTEISKPFKDYISIYVATFGTFKYFIPSNSVDVVIPKKNYDNLKINDEISQNSLVVENEYTMTDLKDYRASVESEICELSVAESDINAGTVSELEDLQKEFEIAKKALEDKKKCLLNDLREKESRLNQKLEEAKFEIFKLESQIYSLRCFNGELVNVQTLRRGEPATKDTPLVFFQKIRFLDEELGKMFSLYNFDFSDINSFEEIVKHRLDLVEKFIPAERGLCLLKVSRNGLGYADDGYNNILKAYEKYRGDRIALFLRDSERVYLIWTDENKIQFSEDSFYKEEIKDVFDKKGEYESDLMYEDRLKAKNKQLSYEALSRYFVFNILTGILDRGLIEFEDKIDDITKTKWIVYSYADNMLEDKRFMPFGQVMSKSNSNIQQGDMVLTLSRLYDGFDRYSKRGYGYNDRSYDVDIKNNEVMPINKIISYVDAVVRNDDDTTYNLTLEKDGLKRYEGKIVSWEESNKEKEYYVSGIKRNSYCGARSNMRIYSNEFINLTYINSVYLRWLLTKNANSFIIGGNSVDFAHFIPYIKKMLTYVEKREEEIEGWIKEVNPSILNLEWQPLLSDFMFRKNIHNFSKYQIKRFIKEAKK